MTPNVGAAAKPAVIAPPKLKDFAPATFPPDALAQGISGRVEIELVVGIDGLPHDLKLKTPAGHGFDEAALEAAQRLTFEAATRDGKPIAARIVFPYVFEFHPPEPPAAEAEPPPPQPSGLEGRVLAATGEQKPLAGVEVLMSNAESGSARRALTGADGTFAFTEIAAGTYHVTLNKTEWASEESDEVLVAGEVTQVVYRLAEATDTEAFHATARVPPPPREVTRRTIGKEELTRIPGTRGDALRSVEILPGVARPPFGSGNIIVRGSSPADTQVLLDGIPVALLYHFGGLTSFINGRLLESVDFYPGNFSVRYGRRRGGIIEASVVEPARDQLHAVADLNLIDGSVLAQGPITSNLEFAAAARRSWIDVTLGEVLKSSGVSTVAAPVYYDYQALATYRPSDRDKLRLMVYGSSDNIKLLFEKPSDQDPAISGNFGIETVFHRVQVTWLRKINDRVDHELEISGGSVFNQLAVGDALNFSLKGGEAYLRSEWRARVTDKVRLIGGLDTAFFDYKVNYSGPSLMQAEGNPDNSGGAGTATSNRSKTQTAADIGALQPALYLESDLDLGALRVQLGSRVDYFSDVRSFSFDPRLSAHYALTDTTSLKGGVGMFSQPPQIQEDTPGFGNPNLKPTRTLHLGLGVDQTIAPGVTVGVEGFYKHLYDDVIGTAYGQVPIFQNGGKGRIYGLEVSAKVDPHGRFFGYLSYTLSRSEREDHNTGYRLFDFDQPHILSASFVYRLGAGWEAGLTFHAYSGNPSTPVVGAVLNKDTGLYSPIYGTLNSVRTPWFQRLDVRIEKQWVFSHWRLAAYIDVQNIYNASNSEGWTYDFEYQQRTKISGLPILPSLGLRGEL
jgi:TonB family protein